jgi:hypothetical protein
MGKGGRDSSRLPTVEDALAEVRALGDDHAHFVLPGSRARKYDHMLAYPAVMLLGLAFGWQWGGLSALLAAGICPTQTSYAMAAVTALLAAAVGPWLPQRLVIHAAQFVRNRGTKPQQLDRDDAATLWLLQTERRPDDALRWLALSILASTAGAVALLTLALVRPVLNLHELMETRFFWTPATLMMLDWGCIVLLTAALWVIHGVILTTLVPLIWRGRGLPIGQPTGLTAGLVVGIAVALLSGVLIGAGGVSGTRLFLLGALPPFVITAVASWLSQRPRTALCQPDMTETHTPEFNPRSQGLIWLSFAAWGSAVGLSTHGWMSCLVRAGTTQWSSEAILGYFLLTVSLGMVLSRILNRHREGTPAGCGFVLWGAGIVTGAAAMMLALWPNHRMLNLFQLCAVGLATGYALWYLERIWLARAGSETLAFAQMTSASLAGIAVGVLLARWYTIATLGPIGTMTAASLMLLAFGGVVEIYEGQWSLRSQHYRLALVFVSLAIAILVFPAGVQRYARTRQPYATQLWQPTDLSFLGPQPIPPDRSVCLLGVHPASAARDEILQLAQVDLMPMVAASSAQTSIPTVPTPTDLPERMRIVAQPPMLHLRIDPRKYALVYQRADTANGVPHFPEYSLEWFELLAGSVLTGGQLIVDVPLEGMNPSALRSVAATLAHVFSPRIGWRYVTVGQSPTLRFATFTADHRHEIEAGLTRWQPLSALLSAEDRAMIHSLRRDRMTALLADNGSDTVHELMQWLDQRTAHEVED